MGFRMGSKVCVARLDRKCVGERCVNMVCLIRKAMPKYSQGGQRACQEDGAVTVG